MFEHKQTQNLNSYFKQLSSRNGKFVYFYRLNNYNENIEQFIEKYYETARKSGVIIEGKIQNPTEQNLEYYDEIMGRKFQMELGFIDNSLHKWLPRMNVTQRMNVATSIYDVLKSMIKEGKNENMLKNAYIKFMCWLYYKFERILNQLGNENIPKILYEGSVGNYELKFLSVLSKSGCDIVLIQYNGDLNYLKNDKTSQMSFEYKDGEMNSFPNQFNLKSVRMKIQEKIKLQRIYGPLPKVSNCTNAWISGEIYADILKNPINRGNDSKLFYNCFCKINGAEDKFTYANDLYQFQLGLKKAKRNIIIVEGDLKVPSVKEIQKIKRGNYNTYDQMLFGLSKNIQKSDNLELENIFRKRFLDTFIEENNKAEISLNKLMNRAIYTICWLNRYQDELFKQWKSPEVGCFIHLGICKNESEALFIKFLSKLPVDVLILNPNLESETVLFDKALYERNYVESLDLKKIPSDNGDIQIGTAAYYAERELDTLMYTDSGMYRDKQYKKAVSVSLKTTYEEIGILWNEELKFRPNFSTVDSIVNIPVIFAKISGVKDANTSEYWKWIKNLKTEDTLVIENTNISNDNESNPIKSVSTTFFKNGKLQKNTIKNSKKYEYSFLREEVQEYILDKLQLMISEKLIKGIGENGTEFTVIATILNLNKNILRLIQKFDFTKTNPKIIYIKTDEKIISLEDSIIIAFLNLIGFDMLFIVPTGYQNIEKHFNYNNIEEHQLGEYMYDLKIPNFDKISLKAPSFLGVNIFRRGGK